MSLLLAQSGHPDMLNQRPLSELKRTLIAGAAMSGSDPKRTSGTHKALLPNNRLAPNWNQHFADGFSV
jgi:hypothetical protein